jgi:hypothetical protein
MPAVSAQGCHVRGDAAKWGRHGNRVAVGALTPSGQLTENHYINHYSALSRKRGKLKRVIDMRMWRNWQTRRI